MQPMDLVNDWWLIIRTPVGGGELHIDQLGPVEGDEQTAAIAVRTQQYGVPAEWWDRPGEGWDVMLSLGEPHPSLMAKATTVTRLEQG